MLPAFIYCNFELMKTLFKDIIKELLIRVRPGYFITRHYLPLLSANYQGLKMLGWEPELALLRDFLTPGEGVFVDIGANIGHYSYLASEIIGDDQVHSFEPLELLYLKLFKPAKFYRQALGAQAGKFDIYTPIFQGKLKYTQASLDKSQFVKRRIPVKKSSVEVIPLDSMLDLISQVQLIKIDVEGTELKVLEGAVKFIERDSPTLMVEIESRHNPEYLLVFNWLKARGYEAYYLDQTTWILEKVPDQWLVEDEFSSIKYNNFIFKA